MSNYVIVPINENGIIYDLTMDGVLTTAMAPDPLGFKDVFVYSHGWSTDAVQSMDMYGRFSLEFSSNIARMTHFGIGPEETIGIGIHWPSSITEDPTSPLNDLQVLTFFTMEHRADQVGQNAVYTILRLLLNARVDPASPPLRINVVGHSFGCRVVSSALQGIANDVSKGILTIRPGTRFNAVLLQGAFDNDDLEATNDYSGLYDLGTRLLISYSELDKACGTWYPLASKLANLFHSPKTALGAAGPTQATIDRYKGLGSVLTPDLQPGVLPTGPITLDNSLVLANLTNIHNATPGFDNNVGGHHSDIYHPELYRLIAQFFYAGTVQ